MKEERRKKWMFLFLGTALIIVLAIFWLKFDATNNNTVEIDKFTGLPIVEFIFYPQTLPDGHYSVAKTLPHGETIVIQHQPGPDRDFVYYVANRKVANVPQDCLAGDRFTIFQGKPI